MEKGQADRPRRRLDRVQLVDGALLCERVPEEFVSDGAFTHIRTLVFHRRNCFRTQHTDSNQFATPQSEEEALIYNYDVTFTGNTSDFMQCYFFPLASSV